ncbi:hypothetical protein [Neisseria iguanae]|uniref:Uncharacterized protein n=1 Tax=Neisseria iguanae TaxID=90242 RepID=A0A2P7TZR0_9NEIS|nr:hypothetical protein [Neisseria iguanae]PSJ80204.1 hypothetical protein C7N83_07635 [Neisseria iguanae]
MKISRCKLKKRIPKKRLQFLYWNELPVPPPVFQASKPIRLCRKIRQVTACHLELQVDGVFSGPAGLDERYSGHQYKGKCGLRAAGKVAVFDISKRQRRGYTVVEENTKQKTLLPAIKRKIMSDCL